MISIIYAIQVSFATMIGNKRKLVRTSANKGG
jgi:hypothetical protein